MEFSLDADSPIKSPVLPCSADFYHSHCQKVKTKDAFFKFTPNLSFFKSLTGGEIQLRKVLQYTMIDGSTGNESVGGSKCTHMSHSQPPSFIPALFLLIDSVVSVLGPGLQHDLITPGPRLSDQ